jgi:hypothetical protein
MVISAFIPSTHASSSHASEATPLLHGDPNRNGRDHVAIAIEQPQTSALSGQTGTDVFRAYEPPSVYRALARGGLYALIGTAFGAAVDALLSLQPGVQPLAPENLAMMAVFSAAGASAAYLHHSVERVSHEYDHSDKVSRGLIRFVGAQLYQLPSDIYNTHIHDILAFLDWLESATSPYRGVKFSDELLRNSIGVKARITRVCEAIKTSPEMRTEIFRIARDTGDACPDKAFNGLSEMLDAIDEIEMMNDKDTTTENVKQRMTFAYRGDKLQDFINQIVRHRTLKGLSGETVELYMYYARDLAKQNILGSANITQLPTHGENLYREALKRYPLAQAARNLLSFASDKNEFKVYLLHGHRELWRNHVRQRAEQHFKTLETKLLKKHEQIDATDDPQNVKDQHMLEADNEYQKKVSALEQALTDHYIDDGKELETFDFNAWHEDKDMDKSNDKGKQRARDSDTPTSTESTS